MFEECLWECLDLNQINKRIILQNGKLQQCVLRILRILRISQAILRILRIMRVLRILRIARKAPFTTLLKGCLRILRILRIMRVLRIITQNSQMPMRNSQNSQIVHRLQMVSSSIGNISQSSHEDQHAQTHRNCCQCTLPCHGVSQSCEPCIRSCISITLPSMYNSIRMHNA